MQERLIQPDELVALAKDARTKTGKTRAEVARELGVARPTVVQAEEEPERGLYKLRKRIIEEYSEYEVIGPLYLLRRKQ